MKRIKKPRFFIKGQSMLEVVISLGLLIVIVAALAIVTTNGLKNSQESKNQTQAVKLAQDGIEKVRNVAKANCPVDASGTSFWSYNFSNSGFRVYGTCELRPTVGLTPEDLPSPNDNFNRLIVIDSISSSLKKVTVTVSWSDFTGNHNSQISTLIGNYQ